LGAAPVPAAVLGAEQELERLRLENQTLSAVVSVVSSSPDLEHVLDRVVDLLTQATECHACFIYLAADRRLRLRAASPVYAHLVGRIGFGIDEGLAGWSVRNREPAFIRDHALQDPRTIYVPELDEERFQSMVAVPIPSRSKEPIGVIVLHTAAPREFDKGILNVLARAASLVAGAIENARLYESAQQRVRALTRWSDLAQTLAAASDRSELYRLATAGARALAPCDVCRLYELDGEDRLRLMAADPPVAGSGLAGDSGARIVLELLGPAAATSPPAIADALGLDRPPAATLALPVVAGEEQRGILVVAALEPWDDHAPDLLRALGHLLGVALEKADLIERLTEENVARDLFDALDAGDLRRAQVRARAASFDLDRPHAAIDARPLSAASAWETVGPAVEGALRRAVAGTVCDVRDDGLRALLPTKGENDDAIRALLATLDSIAGQNDLAIGVSDARRGGASALQSLAEASEAQRLAQALLDAPGTLLYRDAGAYRYLTHLVADGGPRDHLREAVDTLVEYDRRRRAQLLSTLERYLAYGNAYAPTARSLNVHVNTLRQRLERIQELTGLSLEDEDLLALQLAIKLSRLRRPGAG
jgi:GAF domain-containing protein